MASRHSVMVLDTAMTKSSGVDYGFSEKYFRARDTYFSVPIADVETA